MDEDFTELYGKSNLVSDRFVEKMKSIQITTTQVRPEWYTNLSQFYKDYLSPNILPLIGILLLIIFLIYRYLTGKNDDKKKLTKKIKKYKPEEYEEQIEENYEEYKLTETDELDNDEVQTMEKMDKYYEDLEQSGLVGPSYMHNDGIDYLQRMKFDKLAKIISG